VTSASPVNRVPTVNNRSSIADAAAAAADIDNRPKAFIESHMNYEAA